jgi:hypothetical protein
MGELATFVKEHPVAIFAAVAIVALIAYMQRSTSGGATASGDPTFIGGGVHSAPMDANIAATEQARIQAGSSNLSTLAQLLLGEQQSSDAVVVREHETSAALTSSLAQTDASLRSSLAQTAASLDIASAQSSAAIQAANITANAQAAITAANVRANDQANQTEQTRLQFQKDEQRAGDNTSIVNGVVSAVSDVVKFLTFGFL